jgi:hypothetical protein
MVPVSSVAAEMLLRVAAVVHGNGLNLVYFGFLLVHGGLDLVLPQPVSHAYAEENQDYEQNGDRLGLAAQCVSLPT